jgi:hypothetical protein
MSGESRQPLCGRLARRWPHILRARLDRYWCVLGVAVTLEAQTGASVGNLARLNPSLPGGRTLAGQPGGTQAAIGAPYHG